MRENSKNEPAAAADDEGLDRIGRASAYHITRRVIAKL